MKLCHHRPAHLQLPAKPLVTKFPSSSVDARSPTLPIFRQYKPSSNGANSFLKERPYALMGMQVPPPPNSCAPTTGTPASAGSHYEPELTSWGLCTAPIFLLSSPPYTDPSPGQVLQDRSRTPPCPVLAVLEEAALGREVNNCFCPRLGDTLYFKRWLCPASTRGSHAACHR